MKSFYRWLLLIMVMMGVLFFTASPFTYVAAQTQLPMRVSLVVIKVYMGTQHGKVFKQYPQSTETVIPSEIEQGSKLDITLSLEQNAGGTVGGEIRIWTELANVSFSLGDTLQEVEQSLDRYVLKLKAPFENVSVRILGDVPGQKRFEFLETVGLWREISPPKDFTPFLVQYITPGNEKFEIPNGYRLGGQTMKAKHPQAMYIEKDMGDNLSDKLKKYLNDGDIIRANTLYENLTSGIDINKFGWGFLAGILILYLIYKFIIKRFYIVTFESKKE